MTHTPDNGGPAFPHNFPPDNPFGDQGMTLRDWFAGAAREDDIFPYRDFYISKCGSCISRLTREQAKYAYADAMIEARKGEKDE